GNYPKLLSWWVKGLDVDWHKLYKDYDRPSRISLPGYPFMKEYFGLPDIYREARSVLPQVPMKVHPMVHKNISTFSEQKFIATFSGDGFFLKDHVVSGEKFLPGVAYLEMVRAAMELAANDEVLELQDTGKDFAIQLKNVAWIQPAVVKNES